MPRPVNGGRKSRKSRRQLWIVAVAVSTLFSGLFSGNALDASLLASEVHRTTSFEEGWDPFHQHLARLSELSAWIALIFFIGAVVAFPRARRAAMRYFPAVKLLSPKPALFVLAGIFLVAGVAGYLLGTPIDRMITATGLTGPAH